ncbi:hypothetical protein F5Y12DRAFT_663548 [Xylaria sp. FL1777]|nr:hypothetical protein F5Y12DRAFT_663548 [Xylaria sp. FL1777]
MDSAAVNKTSEPEYSSERFADIMDRTLSKMEQKGHADLVKPFREAITDFMTEFVTLAETQATLESILRLAEDQSLRVEYAAFLDAPLDTDEQQVTARAALCQILGGIDTMPQPKNWKIVAELLRKIPATAAACWPGQRDKFRSFMSKNLRRGDKDSDEEQQRRKELLEMTASQASLQELLVTLWQEMDSQVQKR